MIRGGLPAGVAKRRGWKAEASQAGIFERISP